MEEFAKVPGLTCFAPQGAFYALVDISSTGMKAQDFAMDLLEKNRVIVVPGHAFGETSDKYIRLSFATSEETIREGIRRIGEYMKNRQDQAVIARSEATWQSVPCAGRFETERIAAGRWPSQ